VAIEGDISQNLYMEKLAWFKRNEKPETVLLVSENTELIKIILAWTNIDVKCAEKLTDFKSESEKDIWGWLWENTIYSKKEFIDTTGIHFSETALDVKLKPLISNRILYPDGTINSYVQRYLRERVVKLFETRTKSKLRKL